MDNSVSKLALGASIILLALLSIGGAIWLINDAGRQQIAYEQTARSNAEAYAQLGRLHSRDRCRSLAGSAQRSCLADEAAAARNLQRDEFDLEAQRTTAIWTKYMGIAAILGTGFGVVGLALVLATFGQNKRSADAAHDANRPWLELEVTPGDLWLADDINLELSFSVTNRGNSPATNVVVLSEMLLICQGDQIDRQRIGRDTLVPLLDEARRTSSGTTIFPGRAHEFEEHGWATEEDVAAARAKKSDVIPFLIAGVAYQHAGRRFYTIETFGLVVPDAFKRLEVSYAALIGDFELARHHNSFVV